MSPPNVTVSAVAAATTVTVPVAASAFRAIGPSEAVLYPAAVRDSPASAKSLVPERVMVRDDAAGVSTVTTPSVAAAVTIKNVESVTPATVARTVPSFVSVMITSFAISSAPPIGTIPTHVPKSMSDTSMVVIALVIVIDALTVSV